MIGSRTRLAVAFLLAGTLSLLVGCPDRFRRRFTPTPAPPVKPARPGAIDEAVSDVATGGAWEAQGATGVYRVVVRGGGRRGLQSTVLLQWLRWDSGREEPVLVKSAAVTELARGGVIVTASRIDQDEGRTVVRLSLANAVSGTVGEARIWPDEPGRYRVKLKWLGEYD